MATDAKRMREVSFLDFSPPVVVKTRWIPVITILLKNLRHTNQLITDL